MLVTSINNTHSHLSLQIVNAKDKQLEVSRSMKVTLSRNKSKFQTLEAFLSTIDGNGTTKDISSRCADLDFVMYEELGMLLLLFNTIAVVV